jgi:putative transposase
MRYLVILVPIVIHPKSVAVRWRAIVSFLTCSDGSSIESPQFLKQSLNTIKKASKQHSKKLKGSSNRERARKNLVRKHEDICNARRDR